jgi:hypothetical protein
MREPEASNWRRLLRSGCSPTYRSVNWYSPANHQVDDFLMKRTNTLPTFSCL